MIVLSSAVGVVSSTSVVTACVIASEAVVPPDERPTTSVDPPPRLTVSFAVDVDIATVVGLIKAALSANDVSETI